MNFFPYGSSHQFRRCHLQWNNIEKLIFVNTNSPNYAKLSCNALNNLVEFIDSKLDLKWVWKFIWATRIFFKINLIFVFYMSLKCDYIFLLRYYIELGVKLWPTMNWHMFFHGNIFPEFFAYLFSNLSYHLQLSMNWKCLFLCSKITMNEHPPTHHPLDARYHSVVDEAQLTFNIGFTLVTNFCRK